MSEINLDEYEQQLNKAIEKKSISDENKKAKNITDSEIEEKFFNVAMEEVIKNINTVLKNKDLKAVVKNGRPYSYQIEVTKLPENFDFALHLGTERTHNNIKVTYYISKNHTTNGRPIQFFNAIKDEALKKEILDAFFAGLTSYIELRGLS